VCSCITTQSRHFCTVLITSPARGSEVLQSVCRQCTQYWICTDHHSSQENGRIATKLAHDGLRVSVHPGCAQGQSSKVTWYGHFCAGTKIASWGLLIGIRGIIHYSRQVCNLLFLAFQYSSPGGSTNAGEVCYLRLPCSDSNVHACNTYRRQQIPLYVSHAHTCQHWKIR